ELKQSSQRPPGSLAPMGCRLGTSQPLSVLGAGASGAPRGGHRRLGKSAAATPPTLERQGAESVAASTATAKPSASHATPTASARTVTDAVRLRRLWSHNCGGCDAEQGDICAGGWPGGGSSPRGAGGCKQGRRPAAGAEAVVAVC